jgi:hypothetical protein
MGFQYVKVRVRFWRVGRVYGEGLRKGYAKGTGWLKRHKERNRQPIKTYQNLAKLSKT